MSDTVSPPVQSAAKRHQRLVQTGCWRGRHCRAKPRPSKWPLPMLLIHCMMLKRGLPPEVLLVGRPGRLLPACRNTAVDINDWSNRKQLSTLLSESGLLAPVVVLKLTYLLARPAAAEPALCGTHLQQAVPAAYLALQQSLHWAACQPWLCWAAWQNWVHWAACPAVLQASTWLKRHLQHH